MIFCRLADGTDVPFPEDADMICSAVRAGAVIIYKIAGFEAQFVLSTKGIQVRELVVSEHANDIKSWQD